VKAPGDFAVWVDYAHTPESLENILSLAREVAKGRVIAVFGCGGDRDSGKRPEMGKIAGDIADYVVITDDNPRTEDEDQILDQIEEGLRASAHASGFSRKKDRAEAIRLAVEMAGPGDIVVIAGKGHETYQEFRDCVIDFDDASVAAKAMRERAGT
jgi:UDP-N-acetylmuramoyl-L-alanyl-D-glutamate--2,6-diaminopimelate ligase